MIECIGSVVGFLYAFEGTTISTVMLYRLSELAVAVMKIVLKC